VKRGNQRPCDRQHLPVDPDDTQVAAVSSDHFSALISRPAIAEVVVFIDVDLVPGHARTVTVEPSMGWPDSVRSRRQPSNRASRPGRDSSHRVSMKPGAVQLLSSAEHCENESMTRFYLHASTTTIESYLSRVQQAEELNYSGLFVADGQLDVLDPFQLIAASRTVTSRITVGTAATNVVFRDPTLLAGEAATANQITGGRFILGIGTGDSNTYTFGRKPTKLADMEQATRDMRSLLSGGTVDSAVGPVRLRYSPGDTTVPIYFAVDGPRGLEAAGRVADGVMLGSGFDLNVIESARRLLAKGAEEAGRDPESIHVMAAGIIYVSEDGETARKLARRRIANRAHHNFRLSLESVPEAEREGVRRFMEAFDISRPLEERVPVELISDYLVRRFTIAGTPGECIDRVREMLIGVESFLLTPPEYAWQEVAQMWAEEVMPHVT